MNKKILIGSLALKLHCPKWKNCLDIDILTDYSDRKNEQKYTVEYHNAYLNPGTIEIYTGHNNGDIISLDELYTLVVSHIFWNIKWFRHMDQILCMQYYNAKLIRPLLKTLYDGWIKFHGKKLAYLNKSNEQFFTDSVKRKYVHDDIHLAIAYYDRPLYEKIKPDLGQAKVSYDMFLSLSYEDKLKLCREEIYVTALERFLIPNDFKCSNVYAYTQACKQLITSMTKGWFPLFIVENWSELKRPDIDFVRVFKDKEKSCRKI